MTLYPDQNGDTFSAADIPLAPNNDILASQHNANVTTASFVRNTRGSLAFVQDTTWALPYSIPQITAGNNAGFEFSVYRLFHDYDVNPAREIALVNPVDYGDAIPHNISIDGFLRHSIKVEVMAVFSVGSGGDFDDPVEGQIGFVMPCTLLDYYIGGLAGGETFKKDVKCNYFGQIDSPSKTLFSWADAGAIEVTIDALGKIIARYTSLHCSWCIAQFNIYVGPSFNR